jgi:hypothetical protein
LERKFSRLADRGNATILDDQRAVADDPAARINGDEVIDVCDDEARHAAQSSWLLLATSLSIPKFASLCGTLVFAL